jgi:hypothetical protein
MLQSLRRKLSGDEPKETYVQDWLNRRWCRVLIPGCSRILHDALAQPLSLSPAWQRAAHLGCARAATERNRAHNPLRSQAISRRVARR